MVGADAVGLADSVDAGKPHVLLHAVAARRSGTLTGRTSRRWPCRSELASQMDLARRKSPPQISCRRQWRMWRMRRARVTAIARRSRTRWWRRDPADGTVDWRMPPERSADCRRDLQRGSCECGVARSQSGLPALITHSGASSGHKSLGSGRNDKLLIDRRDIHQVRPAMDGMTNDTRAHSPVKVVALRCAAGGGW